MPRQAQCPACNAIGGIAPYDDTTFGGRGKLGSRAVVKCLKCGRGLLFGVFSGMFFGKPSPVPEDTWREMEALWNGRL